VFLKKVIYLKYKYPNYFDISSKLTYQQLLTNPILDIAARFWEKERYTAAKICYRAMRVIDDLIDSHKSTAQIISEVEKKKLTAMVYEWGETINSARLGYLKQKHLIDTITRFQIPMWPWHRFAQSMIFDIHNDGFQTFPIFLRYVEGAAVAPASIFLHLCGVVKVNGYYEPPPFDIRKVARPAARFCYLVHIIRDFQKDQNNNLNYFADSLIANYRLNPLMLKEIAAGGEITPGFRNLIKKYCDIAEFYRQQTTQMIEKVSAYLKPRYTLSLGLLYNLYLQIFERIDILHGKFTTAELNPSPENIQKRVNHVVSSFESGKTKIL